MTLRRALALAEILVNAESERKYSAVEAINAEFIAAGIPSFYRVIDEIEEAIALFTDEADAKTSLVDFFLEKTLNKDDFQKYITTKEKN